MHNVKLPIGQHLLADGGIERTDSVKIRFAANVAETDYVAFGSHSQFKAGLLLNVVGKLASQTVEQIHMLGEDLLAGGQCAFENGYWSEF